MANTKLAACYFLSGDEVLLLQEARDMICTQARQAGFLQRQIITIDSANDWSQLPLLTQNHGLFNSCQLLDLRISNVKIDKAIAQLLEDYVTRPSPDTMVIFSFPKLTAAQKKAKWFKALESHMEIQFIWPLQPRQLPVWIQTRLKQHHLTATPQAIKLLITLTEGNLLATNQAIEKLALCFAKQTITEEQVSHVIHDSAQYTVFDLINLVLAGRSQSALRALQVLQATGGEAILVLWALSRELRELYDLVFDYQRGIPLAELLNKQWANKKPLLQLAIPRLSLQTLEKLIARAGQTDMMIKGVTPGNPWENLQLMTLTLSGAQV